MSKTYILHYAPDNASVIVRMALECLDVPYETELVERATQAQDSAAYRTLNPLGMIPALETPAGVIFETGAILLWLADKHGALFPGPTDPARGDGLKWLFFLSNSLHAGLRQMFYPEKFIANAQAGALRAGLSQRLHADFAQLDQLAGDADFTLLGGADPSLLDFYAATLLRWAQLYPQEAQGWFDPACCPILLKTAARLESHPSVRAAQSAEGLGPAPFSKPTLSNPPIGSAT